MLRILIVIQFALLLGSVGRAEEALTPGEARQIAEEAYVYGFPMVDNYRINYSYFVDRNSPEFKAPWNKINNTARVYTPEDKAIQTPNSDTPYSQLGMDLRAEPLVLTVPKIEKGRYFSVQFIDAYTFNFAYIGSRATGNDGGHFMVVGPKWKGKKPAGVSAVYRAGSDFAWALYRTQLLNPADLENVKAIQAGYKVQTLSEFLGSAAPTPAPSINFVHPLSVDAQRTSPEYFNILNFVLQYCPTDPSEVALRKRFEKIGVIPGKRFDPSALQPQILDAVKQGMADARADYRAFQEKEIDTLKVTSGDLFGTRAFLKNNYLYRMAGAVLGIYGNSKQEAMYPAYLVDANGAKLDGKANSYTLHFKPDELPPVNAFWSLTLYELPSSLLYANPINRYLINSPMLPNLKRDPDGGLTLYVQHQSPGPEREANWLPAPEGPFWAILRLYWPKPVALSGKWKQPLLQARPVVALEKEAGPTKVSAETYIRAETDRSFHNIEEMAGGINRFYHFRSPTPLDHQTVVRMNRDTLYSAAIVDASKGATVTLPKADKGRYISALIIDNDHYAPVVFDKRGVHKLPRDTKYALIAVRIQLFDPKDAKEVAYVNSLQDQVLIHANSADPMLPNQWDQASLQVLTKEYEAQAKKYDSWKGMMGPRGSVNEAERHIAAAAAWGLNPDKESTYLSYSGQHDPDKCYTATYQKPDVRAFWSITVYGADGYMKNENNILNSSNAKINPDGSFTVYFGSKDLCGDVPNRLDVSPGWNFLMRAYRPGPSILGGAYKLPEVVELRQ